MPVVAGAVEAVGVAEAEEVVVAVDCPRPRR